MSGFNFTQLLGGGGGGNIVIAGGISFPDWDSILASTSLSQGDYIIEGESVYRWVATDGVSGAGFPVRHWVYESGTVSRVAYITGDETQDSDLTAQGWTTVDDVSYPGGGVIELDSIANTGSFLFADHLGNAGDLYYMAGYIQLASFTGGSNSTRIASIAIGDGSQIRYLNLAESTGSDRLYTNISNPVISDDVSVSSGLVWVEWMLDGSQTVYGHAAHSGAGPVIASGNGLANATKSFRIQAGITGTEDAIVQCRNVGCYLIEV